jgi:hypothetical protein
VFRKLALAVLATFALLGPVYAADPQTFKTEDSATKFCKAGNVVWFNPKSKIYFETCSRFYSKTEDGDFTYKAFTNKETLKTKKRK